MFSLGIAAGNATVRFNFAVSPSNGFPFKARPLRQFKSYRLMHSNVLIVTQVARNVSCVEKKKNRICCPFFFPLPLFYNNAWRRGEVSSVEKGFVGDSFFYSFLYVFTNLLLIWSRASLGLSDIWVFSPPRCFFFLFCFVLVLCVCVADFQFVKSILRAVVSTFVLWFLDIVIQKICVYFSSRRDGLKWMDSKHEKPRIFLRLMFFCCCRFFFFLPNFLFCFGVRCNDCCKQICFAFSLVVNLLVQRILVCMGIRICN